MVFSGDVDGTVSAPDPSGMTHEINRRREKTPAQRAGPDPALDFTGGREGRREARADARDADAEGGAACPQDAFRQFGSGVWDLPGTRFSPEASS